MARSLVFKAVRPLRHSSRGDAFERVQQQPVKHLTIEMLLRRNSVRNHDVKERDHLLAFGVEDEVMGHRGGCSRSFLHLGRLRLRSGAMLMTQFDLLSEDKALENIAAVWRVAGQHWLRGMEGAAVMHGCGQY